jgi:hypothetical protein
MNLSKIIFMIQKLFSDLNYEPYHLSDNFTCEILDEYYFVFEENPAKLNKLITSFNKNGVPLNSTYIDVKNPKLHYYPISIGQFGLAVFGSFLKTQTDEKKEHFLRIANWFYENRIEDDSLGVYWLTDVPKPEYGISKPWKSAFVQGRALSILLRAWQITLDNKYLETSKKALIPFTFDIRDNGVTAYLKNGHPFYEEYVADEPTMVLDGHLFSLFGIFDFVRAVTPTMDEKNHNLAKRLFNEGVTSLLYWLPYFDLGFWLRFNLCKMKKYPKIDPCTIGYFRLVTKQLKVIYKISKNESIQDYQQKFEKYDRLRNIFNMYNLKFKALKQLNRI